MARQAGKRSNEQLFCWEQIEKTNRLFRVSYAFAESDHAARALPLHALFSVVEEACSRYTDEQIARSKLAWWRQECLGRDPGPGSHPIVRELTRDGPLGERQLAGIARLLEDAESRLDETAPPDLGGLQRRCAELSAPQLDLENSLCGFENGDSPAPERGSGAPGGLVQLMRESLRSPDDGAFWWLPLDLLARCGVSRSDVRKAPESVPVRSLFSMMLGRARNWDESLSSATNQADRANPWPRHMVVQAALYVRQLGRLERVSPGRFKGEVNRITPMDLYHAWRVARRVNRP